MSVCVANDIITPVLWPHNLTRLDLGLYDPDVRPGWRHVPETADGMCDWASIVQPDVLSSRTGERRMIYKPSVVDSFWPSDAAYEVAIILHGFVASLTLFSREPHAPAAIRTIHLKAHGHLDAFDCQRNTLLALEDFTEFVEGASRLPSFNDDDFNPTIRAEQNVFARVRPTDRGMPSVRLTNDIDRGRHARRIASRWRVVPPPPTFIRRPSGNDFPISAHAVRPGDFVELTISPTIRRIRRDGTVQPTLAFEIVKVVKLRSSAELTTRLSPYPIHPIPVTHKVPFVTDDSTNVDNSCATDDGAFSVVDDTIDIDTGAFCLTPLPDDDMTITD